MTYMWWTGRNTNRWRSGICSGFGYLAFAFSVRSLRCSF